MRGSASPSVVSALAALLIGVAGCTICPDPFDYSGPVPNGSVPQNDFRARSGGIAPLDGAPRPWPPVVQVSPAPRDEPPAVLVAAESPVHEPPAQAAKPEPEPEPEDESTVEPAAAEAPVTEGEAATPSPVEAEVDAEPVPPPTPAEPVIDDILPPVRPPRDAIAPPPRETPGWRPRD